MPTYKAFNLVPHPTSTETTDRTVGSLEIFGSICIERSSYLRNMILSKEDFLSTKRYKHPWPTSASRFHWTKILCRPENFEMLLLAAEENCGISMGFSLLCGRCSASEVRVLCGALAKR